MTRAELDKLETKLEVIDAKIIWCKSRMDGVEKLRSSTMDYFDKSVPKYVVKNMLEIARLDGTIVGLEMAKEILLRG